MHSPDSVIAALDASRWPAKLRSRALTAASLSFTVYEGRMRDQATPYIEHPLAVVTILREELGAAHPETLILGLLHDALEVAPAFEPEVSIRLGRFFTEKLRAMTPDHRLEDRPKRDMDEAAWRLKMRRLSPDGLLIRFADRIHNLRDLHCSPDVSRHQRFIASLVDFYLPLAKAARTESSQLKVAYELLLTEYEQYQAGGMALT